MHYLNILLPFGTHFCPSGLESSHSQQSLHHDNSPRLPAQIFSDDSRSGSRAPEHPSGNPAPRGELGKSAHLTAI